MLTRKHAQAIADIIKARNEEPKVMNDDEYKGYDQALKDLQEDLFEMLKDSNPRMDRQRFMNACGLSKGD